MQFDIQHWIEVSDDCDVPAALNPSLPPWSRVYTNFLTGRPGGPQRLSINFGRKKGI